MSKQQEYLESVTERLIKQIENNQASWQRPYEAGNYTGTDVPVNIKGKPYNGMNMLNLWAIADEKGYTDNRWITFNGAKELGAKLKKGEKPSDIYYWKFTDTLTANKKDKDGNDVLDEKGKPIKIKLEVKLDKPKVFWAKVFNGDQLEGMPPR
ncbi:ArdC-like ssDNA-binding domain-containing protein, partial [Acinetobacter towneri]|uniref:ArdC-like ssDNA-binding domain-containing protein n=1 Tax=Acinetobacter towneri TaxID=202956 RepID=UPI0034D4A302